ncbi:MAG: ABC transporter transmembrane domain-containing protein, partial [Alphaproteobacteria bacterium]
MDINYNNTYYLVKRIAKENVFSHWKILSISIALMLVVAGTTSFHAWLIKPALDSVFVEKDYHALIYIPILVVIVTIIKGFATYFQLLTMNYFSLQVTSDLRIKLYRHFITSDISKLHSKSSGDMIASIINEIGSVVGLINISLNGFIKQLFTLLALIAVMFNQSLELSLIAFVGFPLAVYPIYKLGRKLRNLSFKNQEMSAKFNSQMSDTLQYSKL